MKAADVTQHSLDVPKATLAAENPILGTWKLQSLVYEVSATGQLPARLVTIQMATSVILRMVVCMRSVWRRIVQSHVTWFQRMRRM